MILEVGEDGVLIPNSLLEGAGRVHLWKEGDRIVVRPIAAGDAVPVEEFGVGPASEGVGSIFQLLGSDPIDDGPADAAERHDFHIDAGPDAGRPA